MNTQTELQRERFALLVAEATVEGSMHLHGILGALMDEIKLMRAKLVQCPANQVTAIDKLHACNLADLVVESMTNDLPLDPEHLLATVDPEDSLGDDCDRAAKCVREGLKLLVKGMRING